jgi:hypothetical protein
MRAIQGLGNWVLILMATASLVSMIAAFRLDMIVNQDLYSHGLQFSNNWALPYWDTVRLIFAMAWLNLITAIAFQIYRLRAIRKSEEEERNANTNALDKKLNESTETKDQTTPQKKEEEVQIIPVEPQSCEQIESKASE